MSNLEVLEWALVGVEERLGYFLKVSERNELNAKRDYLVSQITIQKVAERRRNLNKGESE